MKNIQLKPKTKELLKKLDEAIKAKSEQFQKLITASQAELKNLQNQKQNILGVIIVEMDLSDDQHFKLDENYDLIEIPKEEFNKLASNPQNLVTEAKNVPKKGKKMALRKK